MVVLGQRASVVKNLPNYDRKRVHFGFTVGVNTMDFVITNSENFAGSGQIYSIENLSSVGFHLGPVSNFRLGRYFDLRLLIDLTFGQRNMEYLVADDTSSSTGLTFHKYNMQIESIFIESPLLIKYKAKRHNNYRPYIIAGINPKYDLSAKKEIKEEEMPKLKLNTFDLYYEVGLGIDFYLQYFKFSTEVKFGFGMFNQLEPITDPTYSAYTNTMDKITSRLFMVSFHFE